MNTRKYALTLSPLFYLLVAMGCSSSDEEGDGGNTRASGDGDSTVVGSPGSGTGAKEDDGLAFAGDGDVSGAAKGGGSASSGEAASDSVSGSDGDAGDGDGEGGFGGSNTEADVPARVQPPNPQTPPAGQLTAGIFDDNLSFDFFKRYREGIVAGQMAGLMPFELSDHEAAFDLYKQAQRSHRDLEISLVIDTTGSMGDELNYLQSEFDELTSTIADIFPQAGQRWSFVMYRDEGDAYLTRSSAFTSDLDEFRTSLGEQGYDGGGDFPEAPEEGLAASNDLDWGSAEDTARLLFWVADAPHHDSKASAMADAVKDAQEKGIHIYPIASSGVDELTEFTMRSSAQLTLGRYMFLTDDSGLGGAHKEPTLPCYFVSTLRDAILRSVSIEMTGEYRAPSDDELIRWGGPMNVDGACYYGDGDEAFPF